MLAKRYQYFGAGYIGIYLALFFYMLLAGGQQAYCGRSVFPVGSALALGIGLAATGVFILLYLTERSIFKSSARRLITGSFAITALIGLPILVSSTLGKTLCVSDEAYDNPLTSCSLERNTPFGYIGVVIWQEAGLRLQITTDDEWAPAYFPLEEESGTVVKGYFEIYEDAYMVEVKDRGSGPLITRAICVCAPYLRHVWPCRGAAREWLR